MPVPPMGFFPPGFYHPRSRTPSRTPLPSCGLPDQQLLCISSRFPNSPVVSSFS
jgi:hypothetical protein